MVAVRPRAPLAGAGVGPVALCPGPPSARRPPNRLPQNQVQAFSVRKFIATGVEPPEPNSSAPL